MPIIFSGADQLLQDLLKWLLILVPPAAGLMVGYHAFMKVLNSDDPASVTDRNKKMKTVLISAVLAESAMGIVQVFLSYF